MGRHGSRGRFTILGLGLTLTLLVAASPALAADPVGERVTVEHAAFDGTGYAVEYVGVTAEGDASKLAFKIRNTGAVALGVVQLEIEEWHEQGWLEAASSVTLWTDLAPGEERLFTRRLETRPAESGTVYVLRRSEDEEGPGMTARPPGYGLSEKFAISSCTRYCDRCSDKAGDRCIGGVKEVTCSCDEVSASCRYSCYPPPV